MCYVSNEHRCKCPPISIAFGWPGRIYSDKFYTPMKLIKDADIYIYIFETLERIFVKIIFLPILIFARISRVTRIEEFSQRETEEKKKRNYSFWKNNYIHVPFFLSSISLIELILLHFIVNNTFHPASRNIPNAKSLNTRSQYRFANSQAACTHLRVFNKRN